MTPQIVVFIILIVAYIISICVMVKTTPPANNGYRGKISSTNKAASITSVVFGFAFDLELGYLFLYAARVIKF